MATEQQPTLADLVVRYNALAPALGKRPRKNFASKQLAENALGELLKEVRNLKEESSGRKNYNYPLGSVKPPPRADSLRGRCLSLLLKGATFAEVMAMVSQHQPKQQAGVPYKTDLRYRTFRLITSMHHDLGYSMVKDEETGIIRIVDPHGLIVPDTKEN